MPRKHASEIISLHRGTLLLGDPEIGTKYYESEYDVNYTFSRLSRSQANVIHEPLHHPPKWPASFRKNYVSYSDYAGLEERYFTACSREQHVSWHLAALEEQVRAWRSDNTSLRTSMAAEHEVMGAMSEGLRHLADGFAELMDAAHRHHTIAESMDARAQTAGGHALVFDEGTGHPRSLRQQATTPTGRAPANQAPPKQGQEGTPWAYHRGTTGAQADYYECEKDVEYNVEKAKVLRSKGIEHPIRPSPRWPKSFKKHYIHNTDYAALEGKFREARDSANVMGQQVFELKEHVRTWRGDGEKLCMSLADEREHVGAMYERFRNLAERLSILMETVQRHQGVVEGIHARAAIAVPEGVPPRRLMQRQPTLTGVSTWASDGHGSSQGQTGHQGIQAQLVDMQTDIAALTDAVKGMASSRGAIQGLQSRYQARPATAPTRRRHPVIRLKPPTEPIQRYPMDEATGRMIGDNRGFWKP